MNARLDELLQGGLTIERLLLGACLAIAVLSIVWRLMRWLRDMRVMQRGARSVAVHVAAQQLPVAEPVNPGVQLFFLQPEAPEPVAPLSASTPVTERAAAAAAPAVVLSHPMRLPGKPRRESEETVLSPETLLARAHEHIAAGAPEEAATQLRLCVRLASKLKQRETEASARLELGDLARASGDLTTACEHWQLARALFTDLKRNAEMAAAERRMEQAGCPTDWVLTQF